MQIKRIKLSRRSTIVVIILILVLCLVAEGINIVFDPFIEQVEWYPTAGLYSYNVMGGYAIDPDTILQALQQGKTDVLMPELATPIAPVYSGTILWHQSDFLKIANALFEFRWKESPQNWSFLFMLLRTNCGEIKGGFYYADIAYFKTLWYKTTILYTAREIEITPLYRDVGWGGGGPNYPHPIFGWSTVDLKKLKVTADDALNIAEANGGNAAQLRVQNECRIYLNLSGDYGWNIFYENNAGEIMFQIYIDPYTGSFHLERIQAP